MRSFSLRFWLIQPQSAQYDDFHQLKSKIDNLKIIFKNRIDELKNRIIQDLVQQSLIKIIPPTAYQGGKQRIAKNILEIIQPQGCFYDLCCGSGAVSIELVNQGFPIDQIIMLDKGPWGLFWKTIGDGTFDIEKFEHICSLIPQDRSEIKPYIENLSKQPAHIDTPYVFLLLQAASFGSKAIWIENDRWMNCSFRNYWMPTATSNRRSPVNPMMPLPETLLQRVKLIHTSMKGVRGIHGDIEEFFPNHDGTIYIDPPYSGTTMYGYNFDVVQYAKKLPGRCFVSEGKPLSETSFLISTGRAKGGISGERKRTANEEWLSLIEKDDHM